MKISIHAGHGYPGKGAVGACGYLSESICARQICENVVDILRHETKMEVYDHTVDVGNASQILKKIVESINTRKCDIAISIHLNASTDSDANGVECYIYPFAKKETKSLAEHILRNLTWFGYHNRGIKTSDSLYVIKHTTCPTILLEVGFVTNKSDVNRFNAENIAELIAKAIISQYPKEKKTNNEPEYMYKIKTSGKYDAEKADKALEELNKIGINARKE